MRCSKEDATTTDSSTRIHQTAHAKDHFVRRSHVVQNSFIEAPKSWLTFTSRQKDSDGSLSPPAANAIPLSSHALHAGTAAAKKKAGSVKL
jgi:hypothetical protein